LRNYFLEKNEEKLKEMVIIDNLIFYGKEPSINNVSFLDYPSKDGSCLTIFFTGCEHACPECHNLELQKTGKVYQTMKMEEFITSIITICKRLRTNKVVFQGGDPLHPQNRNFTYCALNELEVLGYNTCVYTGYEYSIIKDFVKAAIFVKCGKFNKALFINPEKTDDYIQFASSNQTLYKLKKLVSKNGRFNFE